MSRRALWAIAPQLLFATDSTAPQVPVGRGVTVSDELQTRRFFKPWVLDSLAFLLVANLH